MLNSKLLEEFVKKKTQNHSNLIEVQYFNPSFQTRYFSGSVCIMTIEDGYFIVHFWNIFFWLILLLYNKINPNKGQWVLELGFFQWGNPVVIVIGGDS